MAYISANKMAREMNRKNYPFFSKITDIFYANRGGFISTIVVGNNVTTVIYGIFTGYLSEPIFRQLTDNEATIMLFQTLVSTIVILVTGEFLPKIIFRLNPIMSLNIFSIPLIIFYYILYPISKVIVLCNNFILRLFLKTSYKTNQKDIPLGRIDLDNFLFKSGKNISPNAKLPEEVRFFQNALDFSTVKTRECMVPRTELEAIEIEENLDTLRNKFIESGCSKVLVYKENIDNIIGYVHVSQMFKNPTKLKNIINTISVVPETMTAKRLLEIFTKEHKTIALVVDEFGGTAGIVTFEDVLEEIFGEIDDEHDKSDFIETKINENCYRFSGRMEIDYLNEKYRFELPVSDNYETLAGMVLFYHESIPETMEIVEIENFNFKIIEATKNKIELIELRLKT